MGGNIIQSATTRLPDKQFKYLVNTYFVEAEKKFVGDLGNLLYRICNFIAGTDKTTAKQIRDEISDSEYRLVARVKCLCLYLEEIRVKCERLEYYEACVNIANTITIMQAGINLYREYNYL